MLMMKSFEKLPKIKFFFFHRKVVRVDLVENDELLVIMSGKQPMIKLVPRSAISNTESSDDNEMIKIPETKGLLFQFF